LQWTPAACRAPPKDSDIGEVFGGDFDPSEAKSMLLIGTLQNPFSTAC
jgi:hypothetical protein